MSWPAINHQQGRTLAKYIHELRPDWDVPGIEYALGQARSMASGPDLAIAAIKAATSAHNRTPAIIGLDGPHWRTNGPEVERRHVVPRGERCSICANPETRCRQLAALADDGHPFTPDIAPRGQQLDLSSGELMPVDPSAALTRARAAVAGLPDPTDSDPEPIGVATERNAP